MKRKIIAVALATIIYGVWQYVFCRFDGGLTFGGMLMSLMCSGLTWVMLYGIVAIIWRARNGVDLMATLETDQEKLKAHMLRIMQHNGIAENLKELNDIFRNYPQWELQDWPVFRAWYKAKIDYMMRYPEIYGLKMKADGSPYSKENDPLYDPGAPDWEQFDCCSPDDDFNDIDDEEDYRPDNGPDFRKSAEDGFFMGIGFSITENVLR
ncbi:MAG: hypothetical protein K2M06_04005 [Muribaculaceae bacterium]|nr:hypothetical protein [Muribaculaceae bacterium]